MALVFHDSKNRGPEQPCLNKDTVAMCVFLPLLVPICFGILLVLQFVHTSSRLVLTPMAGLI